MEKIKGILKKYRHILTMLLIFVTAVGVLGWVGYATLPDASTKSERVIVNDDYSALTAQITDEQGIRQNIQVKAGTKLYGLSMNFHIFNRVQFGTVFVDLEDMSGNVLTSASRDMTTILDNTFKGFIFDDMVQSVEDGTYMVHVYIQPRTAEDRIALWKSRTTYDGFRLTENGQTADGTLALQYYTRHTGSDIYGFFAIISALVVIGLELMYFVTFVKKCRLETSFAVAALFMGLIFSLFTPIAGGPDEYVHIASSYEISNDILGIENTGKINKLNVRECDAVMPLNTTVNYDAFRFQDMYQGLFRSSEGKTDIVELDVRTTDIFKAVYLPQTLGITLARVLDMGFVQLVLMGRIFNLMFYIVVVYFAIRLMPVFRATLRVCGLLPMAMQLAGNFSYDTFIIAVSFLLIASIFNLTYGKEKITLPDLILPAVLMCLLAPIKAIYVVMGLLAFILPVKKFANKKIAIIAKCGMVAAVVLFWTMTNLRAVVGTLKPRETTVPQATVQAERTEQPEQAETRKETTVGIQYPYDLFLRDNPPVEDEVFWDPEGDLMPNGDSKYYYSVPYILSNIKQTIKLVMNTITHETGKYLQCIIGTRLGEIIVVDLQASWIWFILILMVLLLSVVQVRGEKKVHLGVGRWIGALVFIAVAALTVAACIMWTPINYKVIFGIQGRYMLPAFPLAVVFLSNKLLTLEKNIDRVLIYAMLPLDIMVVLNVFMIMAGM